MPKRTDQYSEGQVIPSQYSHVLSFSLPDYDGRGAYNLKELSALRKSRRFFENPNGMCAFCGAHFRHGDVQLHKPTETLMMVGHTCADKLGLAADRAAWKRNYADAKRRRMLDLAREAKREKAEAQLEEHPGLREDLEVDHRIIQDIKSKLFKYGSISEKQIELVRKLAAEERKPKVEELLIPVPEIEDRTLVEGVVVAAKWDDWGVYRMLVKVGNEDGYFKLWGSVPAALDVENLRGSRVEFHARIKRSDRDQCFGFFSRPTKARLVT